MSKVFNNFSHKLALFFTKKDSGQKTKSETEKEKLPAPKSHEKILQRTDSSKSATSFSWRLLVVRLICCFVIVLVGYLNLSPLWIMIISALTVIGTRKSLNTSVKQKTVINLARNEKEFLSNISTIPSWVHFNEVETTEWINVLVGKIWPLISFMVKDKLRKDLIPLINSILPTIFQPCQLVYFNLGDVSPRLGGIKVMAGSHASVKEILIDADLYYNGNAEIKLQIGRLIRFTAITAGVKDIEVVGKMRLFLYPIKDPSSPLGAIAMTFINKPKIKFDLSELNLLHTPGLYEAINGVLNKVIGNMLVLPNRLNFRLVPDVDLFHQFNPLPQGILKIHVIEAKNLKKFSSKTIFREKLQPYCIFTLGSQKFYTRVLRCRGENVVWNEKFEALIHQRQGQNLKVDIFSISVTGTTDLFLGTRSIDLMSVWKRGSKQMWLQLEGVSSGLLLVSLAWYELSSDPKYIPHRIYEDDNFDADVSDAFLSVYLDSAEHLAPVGDGKISPYAKLTVDDQEFLSKIERDTFNPVWKKSFNFRIYDLTSGTLDIQIKDHVSDEILGSLKLYIKHLLHKDCMKSVKTYSISDKSDSNLKLQLRLKALRSRASMLDEDQGAADLLESKRKSSQAPTIPIYKVGSSSSGTNLTRTETDEETWKTLEIAAMRVSFEYTAADELIVTLLQGHHFEVLFNENQTEQQIFVLFWVEPVRSTDQKPNQTHVQITFCPQFDETFVIPMKKEEMSYSYIKFIIKYKDNSMRVKDLGQFWFSLYDLDFHKLIEHWFTVFPMNVAPPETQL